MRIDAASDPWRCWGIRFPDGRQCGPEMGRWDGDVWQGTGAYSACRVSLHQAGPTATLALQGFGTDYELLWPMQPIAYVGNEDALLVAANAGDWIENPVLAIEQFCRQQRRPPPQGLTFVQHSMEPIEVAWRYPAMAASPLMVLQDACQVWGIWADVVQGAVDCVVRLWQGTGLMLGFRHWSEAEVWTTPAVTIKGMPGRWHDLVAEYRDGFARRCHAPKPPAWMRNDFTGWVQVMLQREGEAPRWTFADLPELMQRALDAGFPVLHIAGWSGAAFDMDYPNFQANPALGGPDALRQAMATIRAMGGRAVLYTNGRLVDPASSFAQSGGMDGVCINRDGSLPKENWGTSVEFAIACPACTAHGTQLQQEIVKMITEYGCHGVQIDQVASMPAVACHASDHPHSGIMNHFLQPLADFLADTRDAVRAVDPEAFIWVEGQHDLFGCFYDVGQALGENHGAWSLRLGRGFPELASFLTPKRLMMGACGNQDELLRGFVQGRRFDVAIDQLTDAPFVDRCRRLADLRQHYRDWMVAGRYVADQGLVACGHFSLNRFVADDRPDLVWVRLAGADEERLYRQSWCSTEGGEWEALGDASIMTQQNGWVQAEWRGAFAAFLLHASESVG